jgi:hypothetical protein
MFRVKREWLCIGSIYASQLSQYRDGILFFGREYLNSRGVQRVFAAWRVEKIAAHPTECGDSK